MIRGVVYEIDLGRPRGHEQQGRRYGLVVSPSDMPWSMATVIPTSTNAQAAVFRPVVEVAGRQTRLLIDQIRSIDTAYIGEPVEVLSRADLEDVEVRLAHYLGIVPMAADGRTRDE